MPEDRKRTAALPSRWLRRPLRGVAERGLAALGLILLSPVIAACAIAVRCETRGPGFYRQERVGRGGRRFRILKIRTMISDAEAETGPVWSVGHDPRVTRLGRFLRDSHLDELPQLWNVVRGEMSIVGPRPERPAFTHEFIGSIPNYAARLMVRPGITGLAQVRQGPDATPDDVARKLEHDLEYIECATPGLDLRLVAATLAPRLVSAPRSAGRRRPRGATTSSTEITAV